MTNCTLHPTLPTLTNLNWVMWQISIEGCMKQNNLYFFILTEEPVPTDAAEAKLFKTQKMKASRVLQQYMGMVNYQKFAAEATKNNP